MKTLRYLLISGFILMTLGGSSIVFPEKAKAVNYNNLISDGEFTDWQAMDEAGIQWFLDTHGGSRIKTFRDAGKTAAKIIADAARTNGINPYVILATIQKEESIVEGNTNFDYRARWAMGYGVCDGCDSNDPSLQHYAGFFNQVSNGTWQLKRNYSYWATASSAYRVGSTVVIDGTNVHIDNRATSALYRYTPHLHGNENFVNIYSRYKTYRPPQSYDAKLISITPRANYRARPGQRLLMIAVFRNTGTATWTKNGANPMRLGNWGPQDRNSSFTGGNIRWEMIQPTVRRNAVGTFRIWVTVPNQTGTYVERFRPVMEGVTWLGPEVTFTINVGGTAIKSGTKGSATPIQTTQTPTLTPNSKLNR